MSDDDPIPEGESATARPVLSFGEALIDLIVSDGASGLVQATTFAARAGGAPANVAVALARLGVASGFVGVVGADPFGQRLRSGLATEGVAVDRVRAMPGVATTLAFAWKDDRGDGHFWLLRAADVELAPSDAELAAIPGAAAVVVGSVALAADPSRAAIYRAVELANDHDVPVCFDVNLRPTLWPDLVAARHACAPVLAGTTLVKLSLDDARGVLGEGAPAAIIDLLRTTAGRAIGKIPQVVLTDGERGCWFATTAGETRHLPAFSVSAVEPTGAGDAFSAALISRLLARDWAALEEDDVRVAAAAGALATTRPGAWEGLPTAAELGAFLRQADGG